mmetsp:Transcript_47932/g.76806  ORF Transcript_47932/g.76806 Transcript_47932/m.76806 type:complete len:689 (-) Transcript_47932:279-2345(-)
MLTFWCPTQDSISSIWICGLSWTMIVLSWLLFTPLLCYYAYKFYVHRGHPGIRSRHPNITFLMTAVCLWFILIAIPIRYIEGTIQLFRENMDHFAYVTWLFSVSILAFSYSGIMRIWLLYFDICWIQENIHKDWSLILNPNQKLSFFLQTKKTYGNDAYLMKRFVFLLLILASLYALVMKYDPYGNYWNALILVCNIPPFTGLFILFYKTPILNDVWYVRPETKSWILLSTYILICCIVCGPLFAIYGDTHYSIYVQFVFTTSFYVLTLGIPICSLYLVLKWVVSDVNVAPHHLPQLSLDSIARKSMSTPRTPRTPSLISPKYSRKQSLNKLLSHQEGINCFFSHLTREYAFENLLGLIEIYQFLKIVQKEFNIKHPRWDECRLKLAGNVPTSQINASTDSWRDRLTALHNKYIADAAEYQLNLPYFLRLNCVYIIKNKLQADEDEIELMTNVIFETLLNVMDETIKLLNDSLVRFRGTPEYARFESLAMFPRKSSTKLSDDDHGRAPERFPDTNMRAHHLSNSIRPPSQKRTKSFISMSCLNPKTTDCNSTNLTIKIPAVSLHTPSPDDTAGDGSRYNGNTAVTPPASDTGNQTATAVPLQAAATNSSEETKSQQSDGSKSHISSQDTNELSMQDSHEPTTQPMFGDHEVDEAEDHVEEDMLLEEGSFVVLEAFEIDENPYTGSFKL